MDMDLQSELETKAGIPPEAVVTHGEMMRAFEAFKETNDERLVANERRRGDPLVEEKLARINATLDSQQRKIDDITLKAHRPALARGERATSLERDRAQGRVRHLCAHRRKHRAAPARGQGAVGRLQSGRRLCRAGRDRDPDRAAAHHHLADPADLERAHHQRQRLQETVHDGRPGDRLGRRDRRAAADTSPTLDQLSFPAMEIYAMPAATATLLEDAAVNIDQWLAAEVEQAFAQQEGTAFVTGDGSNKPKGFLSYTTVAEASWAWGDIGYIATGAAGAFASSNPSDELVDLGLRAQGGLPGERRVRHEPQDAGRGAQVQGLRRRLPVGAAGGRGRPREPDDLPGDRGRGHARHRRELATRSRSAISAAATWWSTAPASPCCAIPTAPNPTCCSTPPSASAAACRTSTPSSSSSSRRRSAPRNEVRGELTPRRTRTGGGRGVFGARRFLNCHPRA